MNDIQKLVNAYHALEDGMEQFDSLAKEVLDSIHAQEFVSEEVNTDMMQCIMELNKRQKEVFKLYKKANLGDTIPIKRQDMWEQIDVGLEDQKKLDYLEAVRTSFLSLYTDDEQVDKALQKFKDKVMLITVEKYPVDKCLVYIRPFAVFLTVIKSSDAEKTVELVPILMDYFGSKLVAHVTMSKDIYIGEDATEFTMDEQIPEDSAEQAELPKDSGEKAKSSKDSEKKEELSKDSDEQEEAVEEEPSQDAEADDEDVEEDASDDLEAGSEEETAPEAEPESTQDTEIFNLLESDAEKQVERDEEYEQYMKEKEATEQAEKAMLSEDVEDPGLDPDALGTIELKPLEPELSDLPPATIITPEELEAVTRPAKPKTPKKVALKPVLE
ncbi:MAG: hypothetical protein K2K70_14135, partial [Lachnospiraceae bacterium]|nr:hypothetical protein [Lachnospiraceae bacterium]